MELIYTIDEDEYFKSKYDTEVRISVDGEPETLEELLHRFKDQYFTDKEPEDVNFVDRVTFLGFFTRRGRLRDFEHRKYE